MATSLILAERIETTLPKAKELRRLADRLVTLAKRGTLHSRRQAARFVQNKEALRKLFAELAPRFKDRQGGYTRIFKFGSRRGDAADMAAIEYLGYQLPVTDKKDKNKKDEKKKAEKKSEKKTAKHDHKHDHKKENKKDDKKKSDGKSKRSFFGRKKEG
jgi:large subunit ribosomal protein L17